MSVGTSVLSFAGVAAVLTVTPGVDTALVLRAAVAGDRRQARATAYGICAGLLVWALAASAGASALLTASQTGYDVMRFAGAAYMVFLGGTYLFTALRRSAPLDEPDPIVPASPWASFRSGLLTNLLNPKVGAFYIALLPQFVPPGASPVGMGALLGVVHNVETFLWFSILISLAHTARSVLTRPTSRRWMDAATGTVLVGFGARLALASR